MRNIPKEQILRSLQHQNPWWERPHEVPAVYTDCRPRSYLPHFTALIGESGVHRAVVLMGPRRVGKTFLVHHAIQDLLEQGTDPNSIAYFALDQPLFNGLGLEEIVGYYLELVGEQHRGQPAYVFFDEIQYLRNWEAHLKSMVDLYPELRIAVSGSAAAALRLGSRESGAGRFTDLMLPPLTFQEYLMLLSLESLVQPEREDEERTWRATDPNALNEHFQRYLNFGGYPEVLFSKEIQQAPE
ncbi:MAG: AAA family ATPase, partial [Candidatus Bipolaricaulota bacterium]